MARLPNFLVIIRSEKLSGKGQGRGCLGVRKKERFVLGKRTFRSQKSKHFVLRIIYWDYSFFNVSVIRYADVLLLYAECLNDKGETTEAINIINKVRARVNVPALPLTMSKAEVLKHLQDKERPCELALEGSRWYDLVRWGIVEETLKAHNKPFVENYVDTKHQLFPIPHSEFLLNPDWEQNPNYSK